ncbi:MAG: hypothetical protein ACI4V7_08960, partial [Succinivibrionaceae bacterium]
EDPPKDPSEGGEITPEDPPKDPSEGGEITPEDPSKDPSEGGEITPEDPKDEEYYKPSKIVEIKQKYAVSVSPFGVRKSEVDGLYNVDYTVSFKNPDEASAISVFADEEQPETDDPVIKVFIGNQEVLNTTLSEMKNDSKTICDTASGFCTYIAEAKIAETESEEDSLLKVSVDEVEISSAETSVKANEDIIVNNAVAVPIPRFEINCVDEDKKCYIDNKTVTFAPNPVFIWTLKDTDGNIITRFFGSDPKIALEGKGILSLEVLDGVNLSGNGEFRGYMVEQPYTESGYKPIEIKSYEITVNDYVNRAREGSYTGKVYGTYFEDQSKFNSDDFAIYSYMNGNEEIPPLYYDPRFTIFNNNNVIKFEPKELESKPSILAIRDDYKKRNRPWFVSYCIDEYTDWNVDKDGVARLTVTPSEVENLVIAYAHSNNYTCDVARVKFAAELGTTYEKLTKNSYDEDDKEDLAILTYFGILNELRWVLENDNPADSEGYMIHQPKYPDYAKKILANIPVIDKNVIKKIKQALINGARFDDVKNYYAKNGTFEGVEDLLGSDDNPQVFVNPKMSAVYVDNSNPNGAVLIQVHNAGQLGAKVKPVLYECSKEELIEDRSGLKNCTTLDIRYISCGWDNAPGEVGVACPKEMIEGVGMWFGLSESNTYSDLLGKKVFLDLEVPNEYGEYASSDLYEINDDSGIVVGKKPVKHYNHNVYNWFLNSSDNPNSKAFVSEQYRIDGIKNSVKILDDYLIYKLYDQYAGRSVERKSCIESNDWLQRVNGDFVAYKIPSTFDDLIANYAQIKGLTGDDFCLQARKEVSEKLLGSNDVEPLTYDNNALNVLITLMITSTWEIDSLPTNILAVLDKYEGAVTEIQKALENGLSIVDIKNYFKKHGTFDGVSNSEKHSYDEELIELKNMDCHRSWCGAKIQNNFYSDAEIVYDITIRDKYGEIINKQEGLTGVYNDFELSDGSVVRYKVFGHKNWIKSTPVAIVGKENSITYGVELWELKEVPSEIVFGIHATGKDSYGKTVTQDAVLTQKVSMYK